VSATVIDEDEMVASFTNIENDSAIDSGVDDDEVKTLFVVCLGVFARSRVIMIIPVYFFCNYRWVLILIRINNLAEITFTR